MNPREKLQQATKRTDARSIANAVTAAKRGSEEGRIQLCAAMAWAAYSCPDATNAVCDNIATAWLGRGPTPEIPAGLPEAPLENSFWLDFWAVIDGYDEGYDATTITVAVASLAAAVHPDFVNIAENNAHNHPGAAAALSNPVPGYTDVDALAKCPQDSLGLSLHNMLVDNNFDPEVLDRNAIALSELPHSLQYLNTRILQMHDVWHLVAGYETSASHEIAISAFQLAQFGHNYSAMFLAAVMTISTIKDPKGFTVLTQIIMEAWQHGREAPAMMDIEWEDEWNSSLADIRATYKVPPYKSIFPVDLMESVESGSTWKKLQLAYQLSRYNLRLRFNNRQPLPSGA